MLFGGAIPVRAFAARASQGNTRFPGQPNVPADPALPGLDRHPHQEEEYTIGAGESTVFVVYNPDALIAKNSCRREAAWTAVPCPTHIPPGSYFLYPSASMVLV